MKQIDIDATFFVEFAGRCNVLLLVEYAYDTGQDYKNHHVLQELAQRADVPAIIVLYTNHRSRRSPSNRYKPDFESVRVKWIYPEISMIWKQMTPCEYAKFLEQARFRSSIRNDQMAAV